MRLYSVSCISAGSSTCFGCWHPLSGARTTVITAFGTGQPGLLPSALGVELALHVPVLTPIIRSSYSCNYSCTSSWWWVSTPETCRAVYRYVINWIQSSSCWTTIKFNTFSIETPTWSGLRSNSEFTSEIPPTVRLNQVTWPTNSITGRRKRFAYFPKRPDRLWYPPSLLLIGNGGSFPVVKRPYLIMETPSPSEIKITWSNAYTPQISSWLDA